MVTSRFLSQNETSTLAAHTNSERQDARGTVGWQELLEFSLKQSDSELRSDRESFGLAVQSRVFSFQADFGMPTSEHWHAIGSNQPRPAQFANYDPLDRSVRTLTENPPDEGATPNYPRVRQYGKQHHLITQSAKRLLRSLRSIVLSKALKSGLNVDRLTVDIESDPEELTSLIAFRVYIDASAAQAMAFWDSLDIELGRWLAHLGTRDRRTMMERIGLRFHWVVS